MNSSVYAPRATNTKNTPIANTPIANTSRANTPIENTSRNAAKPSNTPKPKVVNLSSATRSAPLYFTINEYNKPNTIKYYNLLKSKTRRSQFGQSQLAIAIVQYFIENNDLKFEKISTIPATNYRKTNQYKIINDNIILCSSPQERDKYNRISQLREYEDRGLIQFERNYTKRKNLLASKYGTNDINIGRNITFLMNFIMNNPQRNSYIDNFYSNIEKNLKAITYNNDWRDILFFLPPVIRCALEKYWIQTTSGGIITGRTKGNIKRMNMATIGTQFNEGSFVYSSSAKRDQQEALKSRAIADIEFIANMIIPFLYEKYGLTTNAENRRNAVTAATKAATTATKNTVTNTAKNTATNLANARKRLATLNLGLKNENWS
jgi:hypothetical protein